MKRKKWLKGLLIFVVTISFTVLVVEFAYRLQWIDFYKAELKALNPREALTSDKPNILIIGDSFSADPQGYVEMMRDSLRNYDIINSSVPGTCILQHELMLNRRLKKFKPDIVLYQFYVGNDLFELHHPVNSARISWLRNVYWNASEKLLSLQYINFRLAGLRYSVYDDAGGSYKPKQSDTFSVENYSKREKFNYTCEPDLIENTLFLRNGREKDLISFKLKFKRMVSGIPAETRKIFLIIPHQAMLSKYYQNRHQSLGAVFESDFESLNESGFPLYREMDSMCKELGFTLISPLEDFRKYNDSIPLYYENDPHLNTEGHKRITSRIIHHLKF